MSIFVTRPSIPDINEYMEEIRPAFENRVLTNMGPIYKKLQNQLIEYLGVKQLSMFVNGHMALEIAIQGMGLREAGERLGGGEVITTPFTFVSTAHAISRNGLKPVFCDIRTSDYTMDPAQIEPLITPHTVAIVPVHVYGNVCAVETIQEIANRHGLKVIYDAAHAFGVTYKGVGIGNYGDASMFSFHATKVFNSIEGGAVAFKNEDYRRWFHELKNFGIHSSEAVDSIGGNAKMNEFAAAMGICNLRRLGASMQSRKAVFERYYQRLSNIPGIVLCAPQANVSPNYAFLPVRFEEEKFGRSRDDVFEALKQQDVFARKYFYPAVNEMSCYASLGQSDSTPIAHKVSAQVLTLPLYEGLSLDDVDMICDIILDLPGGC